jgi:hypothetical protein
MSLHLLILLFCVWKSHSTPSQLLTFSIVWVLSFSKTEDDVTTKEIQWYQHYSSKIVGHTCWVLNSGLHRMLRMLVQSLDLLYKNPRKLLWREQYWLAAKCCYGEIKFSPETVWLHHIIEASIACSLHETLITVLYNCCIPVIITQISTYNMDFSDDWHSLRIVTCSVKFVWVKGITGRTKEC